MRNMAHMKTPPFNVFKHYLLYFLLILVLNEYAYNALSLIFLNTLYTSSNSSCDKSLLLSILSDTIKPKVS